MENRIGWRVWRMICGEPVLVEQRGTLGVARRYHGCERPRQVPVSRPECVERHNPGGTYGDRGLMKRQFGLAIRKHFKIVNILLIAVALVLVSENASSSHPDDAILVEAALHALEKQGEITEAMHTLFDQLYENGNADELAQYLESLEKRGEITADTHIYLQTALRAGVPEAGSDLAAAAPATYSGNGNVTLLGRLNPRAPSTGQLYEGIWGYASAGREYALLTHSQGLSIVEVTDPANPIEIQFIPSAGGRIHRDIDTYLDPVSGKNLRLLRRAGGCKSLFDRPLVSTGNDSRLRDCGPGPDQLDPHSAGGRRPSVRQQRGKQPGLPDLRRAGESGQSTAACAKLERFRP